MVLALSFDGIEETTTQFPHGLTAQTGTFIEVECQFTAFGSFQAVIGSNKSGSTTTGFFLLGVNSSDFIYFFGHGGGAITSSVQIQPSTTYTLRLDWLSQTQIQLSVDGNIIGSNTYPTTNLDQDFYYGSTFGVRDWFGGLLLGSESNTYNHDPNSSDTNSNPPVLIDTIGGNNVTGVNMTDANWVDLGGGGVIVDFTFSINTASLVSADAAFIISSDFQISTASVVSFASAKVQQSDFDIASQSLINIESAKIQSSIFEIDSSSTFSALTGDTNIVEFTFSINSQSTLSADSAKVQSSVFDIESQSNTGIESAKVQASEFNVDSGANVDWSASAIQGRTFAIDSESTFTVVVEGGEPVFIIGLTLELSSDIITLELSSEQEIRELA